MSLEDKLTSGKFLVLAEMDPPKGVDVTGLVANAFRVKGKVDAYVVPEMSNAVMRMSSLGGCMVLQSKGLETVLQVCCRDRNRLALQADLLAAYSLGISTLMAVAGVDPGYGDHHRTLAVNDINLMELLQGIRTLQEGKDMAGIELAGAPKFCVGSTTNAGTIEGPLEAEIEEMEKKAAVGVRFFVTPPVFDIQPLQRLLRATADRGMKIVPTVLLLKSAGMAGYINRHIEHVSVPSELIRRIQKAPDRPRECVRIAAELVSAIRRTRAAGVLLSTIGWEDKLAQILEGVET
ncbi:MAG TPA: methylenetetrahydrofolate reductase [Syntrophobacteraceae bacterium]|nr:methylenetetrahydrofolate reductase [Syntrophobacteraceae bacterium]